ncbi:hypothetical protein BGZ51_005661 [Haplosporangium sp. Z 767]|nr:hypothetical protein BGZ51_005661 [Haplosporangium sp. Z 767]KAF9181339.1 hypothetical protein BGZ50_005579 [Haplosporangium sp. Z 11]
MTTVANATSATGKRPYHRKQAPRFRTDHNASHRNPHQDPHNGLMVYSSHQHQPNPSTLSNFCQSMLRISTMHVLQSAGYDAVQANPMSVLVDCLGRYLAFLAESAKEFAEHSGRSQITAFDVADGLSDLGIELSDLENWLVENGGGPSGTSQEAEGVNGDNINGALEAAVGSGVANRSVLPSWKGADPGRVIHDVIWNGRSRDVGCSDIYEWHALPEGFVMPETDEEQDAYAYPEGSDHEDSAGQRDVPSATAFTIKSEKYPNTRARHSEWIPDSRPPHIPMYMPPFPGSALQEEESEEMEEDQSTDFKPSQTAEIPDSTASATAVSTAGLESAVGHTSRIDDSVAQADLAKLTIKTSHIAPGASDSDTIAANGKGTNADPYIHMEPTCESSFTHHPAVPTNSTAPSASTMNKFIQSQPRPHAAAVSLSQKFQDVFSDAMLTVLEPESFFSPISKQLKRQSTQSHTVDRAKELSNTLSSDHQQSSDIHNLLRQAASHDIVNKVANTDVSMPDAISPVVPAERIMNGSVMEAQSIQEAPLTGSRTSMLSGVPRKGSLSSSPLSTMSYPSKEADGLPTAALGVMPKPKTGSRKSSLTHAPPAVPAYVPTPLNAPAVPMAAHSTTSPSTTQISRSILSRIGSNFDPAAVLAAQSSSISALTSNYPTAMSNGVSSSTLPVKSTAQSPAYPLSGTIPTPGYPGFGNPSQAPLPEINSLSTGSETGMIIPSTAVPATLVTASMAVPQNNAAPKPIPGPISLSELPYSGSSATTTTNPVKTPSVAASTTPSTPAVAPKIRFKFSALDAISTGDSEEALSSKREHGHYSSLSSSHQRSRHRSSSITSSTGLFHHKKSKKSSRDYDDENEDVEDYVREKKKKKKSKSKDKDRDRERDRGRDRDSDEGSSSRHKHHKHHKHHRHDAHTNGSYSSSKSSSSYAPSSTLAYPAKSTGGRGYSTSGHGGTTANAEEDQVEIIECICSNPTLDDGLFMIACDKCEVWFHGRCVGVREGDAVKTWYCQRCTAAGLV